MLGKLSVFALFLLALALPARAQTFGVAAHDDVNIEWWYVNAHVTTEKGRHLALVGSFFRFGNGKSLFDNVTPTPRGHYLIYAVTDLDKKTQHPYSLADENMVALLKQISPLLALANPTDKGAKALMASLAKGTLPAPHQQLAGVATVENTPFRLAYGAENTLTATNAANTAFDISLDAGGTSDKVHLTLTAKKPPMAVGGRGETGLKKSSDMYYFSLTRCAVGGTVNGEKIVGGAGWFDHQWGNSWVAQNNGWDWWGVQLDNGTDILLFRQRDLATGKVFFLLATFMDKNGKQTVTKRIVFKEDPKAIWTSPKTGVKYPLGWMISFPDKNLTLTITAAVQNQEMPILGPGSGIWEGLCQVSASNFSMSEDAVIAPSALKLRPLPKGAFRYTYSKTYKPVSKGVAYMELVGYNSAAVKAKLAKKK